jgi:hypothetical protein
MPPNGDHINKKLSTIPNNALITMQMSLIDACSTKSRPLHAFFQRASPRSTHDTPNYQDKMMYIRPILRFPKFIWGAAAPASSLAHSRARPKELSKRCRCTQSNTNAKPFSNVQRAALHAFNVKTPRIACHPLFFFILSAERRRLRSQTL